VGKIGSNSMPESKELYHVYTIHAENINKTIRKLFIISRPSP
jgi:hypothetical protein